jgi:hypothetical protein
MREICSYGSVGASAGNRRRYPEGRDESAQLSLVQLA